ncbi:probable methyltransferase-like protein 15 homolog [Saccostrea cucullata]|uniref:probable methyltransferase-like protein 15 homolog n=1 Tax=Saccostrea cuccullata TaxID=36930 RepID=UPI002ED475F3
MALRSWCMKKAFSYSCLFTIRRHLFSVLPIQKPSKTQTCCHVKTVSGKLNLQITGHNGICSDSDVHHISDNSDEDLSYSPRSVEDSSEEIKHVPVMVKKVLEVLNPQQGQLFIDMTFGAGGHTKAILTENPEARVVCVDRDPLAFSYAQELAKSYKPGQVLTCLGKFSETPQILYQLGITPGSVDGILFDVGASSMQYDQSNRGFSLSRDSPLDMRMDQGRDPDSVTAMDVVNHLSVQELRDIIKKYGEDHIANQIAHAIVEARYVMGKITTTKQLAEVIENVFEEKILRDKLNRKSHVATRTFQALRIFVNNELNEINNGLEVAYHYLKPGGVCVGISFHSLEDRIFKRHFHGIEMDEAKNLSVKQKSRMMRDHHQKYDKELIKIILKKRWIPVSKKVTTPEEEEVLENPRSRSAKLRAAIKSADV